MIQGLRQSAGSLLQKGFSDVPNGQIVLFPLLFPFFFRGNFSQNLFSKASWNPIINP